MWHTGECIKIKISHNSSPVARSVAKVKTINTCTRAWSRTPTHTHGQKKSEPTASLWTASQVWDKVHSPPLGYQTVAQACIHLWKTWRLFSHTAQLSLYLQMVLLSRNVTFDSVSLTERASQWKAGEGFFFFFFWPPKPDKWAHDCFHGKDWFNTI